MLDDDEAVKELFYDKLNNLLSSVAEDDKLVLLDDFNAMVGTDHRVWEYFLGRHGVGKMISTGLLLVTKMCRGQTYNHKHALLTSKQT